MTFNRKKEPTMTRRTQKIMAIQAIDASLKLYIRDVQPSSVIITKMVTIDQIKLLKFEMLNAINSSFVKSDVFTSGSKRL